MNYNKIFAAAHKTKTTVFLHGSSGFGKTSTMHDYAKTAKATLLNIDISQISKKKGKKSKETKEMDYSITMVCKRTSYIDPLTLFLPQIVGEQIEMVFNDWVHLMINATEHTLVFLDEFTNPSGPEVFNIMKEILGERTILGQKISDHIQFVAASNLTSEDIGVKEMPDSLWKRGVHLLFAPTHQEIVQYLHPHARRFFNKQSQFLRKPATDVDFPLEAVPRQINKCMEFYETKMLSKTELRITFAGLIGKQAGYAFATELEDNENKSAEFPDEITMENMHYIHSFEETGRTPEVIVWLKEPHRNKDLVAQYLAEHAGPEVVRALFEEREKLQLPRVPNPVVSLSMEAGMPWPIYAAKRNCISLKS